MQIANDDFKKIVRFVQVELLRHRQLVNMIGIVTDGNAPVAINAVSEFTILGITDSLTLDGFIKATGEKKERATRQQSEDDKGFAKLWAEYPTSPNFTYRGMKFKGSRVLRSNYSACESKYLKALANHSLLTPEMVLSALKRQKKLAFEESFETGVNKLNHWNGFEVWLNQEKFMAFINDDDNDNVDDSHEEATGKGNHSNFA